MQKAAQEAKPSPDVGLYYASGACDVDDKHLALDAIFLDEAQDLNPLQWKMFYYIEAQCKRSYIAGDDDQTIYNFQFDEKKISLFLKKELIN